MIQASSLQWPRVRRKEDDGEINTHYEYPPPGAKTQTRRREWQCGGLTGTAQVAAARMGARCAYAGALGNAELSNLVKRRLQEEGVEAEYLCSGENARAAHSVIIVDGRANPA